MSDLNFENNDAVGVINISAAGGTKRAERMEEGTSWKMNTPPIAEGAKRRNKTAREGEQEIERKKKLQKMRRGKKT